MSQIDSISQYSSWTNTDAKSNLQRVLAANSGAAIGTRQQDNDIPISGSGKISFKTLNKKKINTRMYMLPNNCNWNGHREDNCNNRADYWDSMGQFHVNLTRYLVVSWTVYRFKLDNDTANDMVLLRGIVYNDYGGDGPYECQLNAHGGTGITNCRGLGDFRWLVILPVSMSEAPHPSGSTQYGLQHLTESPISMKLNKSGSYSEDYKRYSFINKDQYKAGYYVSASFRCAESYAGGNFSNIQGPCVTDLCTRTFDSIVYPSPNTKESDNFAGMINWYSPTDRSFCISTDAGRDNILNGAMDFLVIGETQALTGDK